MFQGLYILSLKVLKQFEMTESLFDLAAWSFCRIPMVQNVNFARRNWSCEGVTISKPHKLM